MKIIADLHIHSRYSRATSSKLNPPFLERWARIKGIELLGTGDCTHPQWLKELRQLLDDAEEGFYLLKKEVRDAFNAGPALIEGLPLPGGSAGPDRDSIPRFVLTGEISTIYKKGEKTRKIHHLVILPGFRAAAAFNARLEGIGVNISSDGRPILGIDSRDLLALLLESDERSLLIPAHIWTPWFSVLGANSGFDSIEECYRDLSPYIPAIETGLSSNPPMNWALSGLDKYSIISNSDAHSPDKLGREATIFEMELSFTSLKKAMFQNSSRPGEEAAILGTVEFFPQEGKYHYDGHRKCGVVLSPGEAAKIKEEAGSRLCPVCGKALTRGVMGRVLELADRPVDEEEKCPDGSRGSNRRPYYSLIPLKEITAELLGTGTASKKTETAYSRLISKGGSEFSILMDLGPGELKDLEIPEIPGSMLAEAIMKMRTGDVSVSPGYDGEYGKVRVFDTAHEFTGRGSSSLFGETEEALRSEMPKNRLHKNKKEDRENRSTQTAPLSATSAPSAPLSENLPDPDQEKILSYNGRETVIIAGPGTGKTSLLTARIARLIKEGIAPDSVLALTFTVKAAAELRERTERLCGPIPVQAATFHSFCCSVLRAHSKSAGLEADFRIISEKERDSLLGEIGGVKARRLGAYIEERKRHLLLPGENMPGLGSAKKISVFPDFFPETPQADNEMEALYAKYREALKKSSSLDFEDLSAGTVRLLSSNPEILKSIQTRFKYIFVDEYQDINFPQYLLIRLLVPGEKEGEINTISPGPSLWVIGDPNQAIYGFRGADRRFIDRFSLDYPRAGVFMLSRSFRCAAPIIDAAGKLTGTSLKGSPRENPADISLYQTRYATEKAEAEGIARTIEALIGGTSFFAMDSGVMDSGAGEFLSHNSTGNIDPGDCAVLIRTAALAASIIKALNDHGIPAEFPGEGPWWTEEPGATLLEVLRKGESWKNRTDSVRTPVNPANLVLAAWEELSKREKQGGKGKETPVNVERLIGLAALFGDLSSLLDTLDACAASLIPEAEFSAGQKAGALNSIRSGGVKVMTIHASKGLEFEQVFVPALEEGILPFTLYDKYSGIQSAAEIFEEERRLLYVAMTRAKKGLWLSYSASRIYRGRKLALMPSRFLAELEKIVPLAPEDKSLPKRGKWDGQPDLF